MAVPCWPAALTCARMAPRWLRYLLILAILSAVAGRLSFSNQLWLRQVGNSAALIQSAQATRAVQEWAGIILLKDDNDYDSLHDLWAQPLPPLPVGPGFVQGYMEDMHARMNLNNLLDERGGADREAVRRFQTPVAYPGFESGHCRCGCGLDGCRRRCVRPLGR